MQKPFRFFRRFVLLRSALLLAVALIAATAPSSFAAEDYPEARALLPEQIKKSGVLRIGSQQTYPPIEFKMSQSGEVMGVSAELLGEVARRLGLRLEWVQLDYGALITGAKAGRFDVVSGGISDQIEREKELDFVNYLIAGTGILCLEERVGEFSSLEDFSGLTLSYTFGAKNTEAYVHKVSDALVAAGREPIKTISLPGSAEARMQLDLKRADGYLNEVFLLSYIVRQNPGVYAVVRGGRYTFSNIVTSWGFLKKNTNLRDAVKVVLQGMLEDGVYLDIARKWGVAANTLHEITINMPWELRE